MVSRQRLHDVDKPTVAEACVLRRSLLLPSEASRVDVCKVVLAILWRCSRRTGSSAPWFNSVTTVAMSHVLPLSLDVRQSIQLLE